jgi:hypothetical protein
MSQNFKPLEKLTIVSQRGKFWVLTNWPTVPAGVPQSLYAHFPV